MTQEMFRIDDRELRRLAEAYKKATRQFTRATADMLNEYAFGVRRESISTIGERMIVRNTRFLENKLRVTKASPGAAMEAQRSETGSIAGPRFTGWREQQTGENTARKRVISLLARASNIFRQAQPKARMKPAVTFASYNDYPGAYPERKEIVMMQQLSRARSTEPFIVTHKRGMTPGLYRFYRGKPRILQVFKKEQPKRIPWHTDAREKYFTQTNLTDLWARKLSKALRYRMEI